MTGKNALKTGLLILFVLLSLSVFIFPFRWGLTYAKEKTKNLDSSLTYVGDVINVEGEGLRIKRVNSPHWLFGRTNMPDYVQDFMETDDKTTACIELQNGSQIGINKKTKIEIISSYQVKDATNRSAVEKIVLQTGTLWAKVRGQKEPLKVQAGKGVMGIKGTEFIVEADSDNDKLTVLEGEVEYYPDEGQKQSVKTGEEITVSRKGKIVRRMVELKKLRDAISQKYPELNPRKQMILAVFASRLMGRRSPGRKWGLKNAETINRMIENPEEFKKTEKFRKFRDRQKNNRRPAPKNLKPGNDIVITYYPKFTWDEVEGAKSYWVLVTRNLLDKENKDPLFYMYAQTDKTELEYPSYGRALKPNEIYFWTVIPVDEDNKPAGRAAFPVKFTMADYTELGIKGLYPCGCIGQVGESLVFDWSPVKGAKKYRVELSNNSDMKNPIISEETDANYYELKNASSRMPKEGDYYWRVTTTEREAGIPIMQGAVNHFAVGE